MRSIKKGVTILATVFALSTAASVAPPSVVLPGVGVSEAQAGQRHHWRHQRGHHRRHYRHYRRHRHGGDAAAAGIIGGIIGLGVGAAIANQPPPRRVYGHPRPWTDAWYAYCSRKYRSFDPRSGTFQPYHGPRTLCR